MDVVVTVMLVTCLFWGGLLVAAVLGGRAVVRRTAGTRARVRGARLRWAGDPRAAAAAARADLARAVRDLAAALGDAQRADLPVGDVPHLAVRLRAGAAEVDARLRVLERLHDPTLIAARLPALVAQAGRVRAGADDLTAALLDAAGARDAERADLRAACAQEAAALREGTRSARLA